MFEFACSMWVRCVKIGYHDDSKEKLMHKDQGPLPWCFIKAPGICMFASIIIAIEVRIKICILGPQECVWVRAILKCVSVKCVGVVHVLHNWFFVDLFYAAIMITIICAWPTTMNAMFSELHNSMKTMCQYWYQYCNVFPSILGPQSFALSRLSKSLTM